MRFSSFTILATALALSVPRPAAGQGQGTTAPARLLDLNREFVAASELAGVPYAAGSDYKARFTGRGIAFTPFLGAAAPRNLPLRLRLHEVQRGTHHDEVSPVAAQRAGRTVRYTRDGIVERYDVRCDGLEQSFTFAAKPAGEGDLVVRLQVETELRPEPRPDGSAAFVWPGLGGVRIGKVTGIDADGETCPGTVRLVPAGLELVLPAAFVESAAYPLVLDPLIGTEFYGSPLGDRSNQPNACATLGTGTFANRFLVAYVVHISALDTDVHAVQVENDAVVPSTDVVLAGADNEIEMEPHMGYLMSGQLERWVGTIHWALSPVGPFRLQLVGINPGPNTTANSSGWFETLSGRDSAFVGGSAGAAASGVVAFCDANGIGGRVVVGLPGALNTVRLVADPAAVDVAVGKRRSATGELLLVWRQPFHGAYTVFAQRFDAALLPIGAPLLVSDSSHDAAAPCVDGDLDDDGSWLVAWEQYEGPTTAGPRDIAAARIVRTATGLAIATPQTIVEGTAGEDEFTPDVTDLGARFLIAWAQNSSTDDGCRAKLLRDDCTRCNQVVELDGIAAGARTRTPQIAAQVQGAADSRPTLLVFAEQPSGSAGLYSNRVVALAMAAEAVGIPPVDVGGGCGLGGVASTVGGGFVVGNDEFAFAVTGADPAAVLFRSIGFQNSPLLCGTCALTQPLAVDFVPQLGGVATSAYPVPCSTSYLGFGLEFQWVSFLTAWSPCAQAPGLSASNRLQIRITN